MAPRNRRMTKKNVSYSTNSVLFCGLLMALVLATLSYYFVDSKCNQLSQTIGRERVKLDKLEKERQRESARWEQLKTRKSLDAALAQHGLAMELPRPNQIVRMDSSGHMAPGQPSVALINRRREELAHLASASSAPAKAKLAAAKNAGVTPAVTLAKKRN